MKRFLLLLTGLAAAGLAACSAGQARPFEDEPAPSVADSGLSAPEDPTEWAYVYSRFFGAGTPGHCGNAGCHLDKKPKGFVCGDSKDACYEGLIKARLLDPRNPMASAIGDPKRSPLAWFGEGLEPQDDPTPNPEAAHAITRWLEAGGKNRGYSSPYVTPVDAGSDADPPTRDAGRDAPGDARADSGRLDAGTVDANVTPPTWTYLYSYYFGASTPGHCGDCHHSTYNGFRCGSTKYSCYQGMVNAGLIDQTNPAASMLGDVNRSPVSWFGGSMPKDNAVANPQAASLVKAWLNAGAPYN